MRVAAYERQHGIIADSIQYIREPFDLRLPSHIEQLISTLEAASFAPDLIVLDTLARLTPGAEENSTKDMGEAVREIDNLRRRFNATVLLIYHPGKHGGLERGSGAPRGAADVMIKCIRTNKYTTTLSCDKMKDAEEFQSLSVQFEYHEFDDGSSSLAVSAIGVAALGGVKEGTEHRALRILEEKFGKNGATHGEWRVQFERDTGLKARTFNRELEVLKKEGLVLLNGSRYHANRANGGAKCHSVPSQCHDTSGNGVMSSPPLGDDTDTTASGPGE